MPKNYVAKEALRQDCGAGVPPAFVRSHVLGGRDGRTTILPKFGGEPPKIVPRHRSISADRLIANGKIDGITQRCIIPLYQFAPLAWRELET